MTPLDVTSDVQWGNPDDELLPITRCVCGAAFTRWEVAISVYGDDPSETMPCCGRRLYFANQVRVFEVAE